MKKAPPQTPPEKLYDLLTTPCASPRLKNRFYPSFWLRSIAPATVVGASAVDYINKDLVAVKPQEVAVNTESNVVAANESVEAPKEAVKEETKLEGSYVTAPVSGIFYSASKPGEPNFVKEGDTVKKGDVLGLIEAMKVMNELLAPRDGVVEKINVSDETFVEYGQELICLKDC